MLLGRHGFHGAFLDAVTGIIETAGIFYQTKFFVLAVAGATSANSDESGLIEGCGKQNFVSYPPMSRAADDAARKSQRSAGRPFRFKPRGAHEPRIWMVLQLGHLMRAW
jgi:hypothetical protein